MDGIPMQNCRDLKAKWRKGESPWREEKKRIATEGLLLVKNTLRNAMAHNRVLEKQALKKREERQKKEQIKREEDDSGKPGRPLVNEE